MAVLDVTKWKFVVIVGLVLIHYYAGMSAAVQENTEELIGHNLKPKTNRTVVLKKRVTEHQIRHKRELLYRLNESTDILNSVWPNEQEDHILTQSRAKREVIKTATTTSTKKQEAHEELPVAKKQTMNSQVLMQKDQWVKPAEKYLEFQSKKHKDENDTDAEESILIQEGIKSRAPRVNFITQQRKSSFTPSEARENTNEKLIRELYHKSQSSLKYEHPWPRTYDSFMATSQSPMYPRIHDKYDSFHRDMMNRMYPPAPHHYDHYERRHDVEYDSYFPRYKFPYYYYYPDRRYDVPLYYRDRNYLSTNNIEQMPHVISSYNRPLQFSEVPQAPARNRRIIYFATLPEIVRKHPKDNFNDRLYPGNRYNTYGIRPFHPASAYKDNRPSKNGDKDDKYVSSKPIKIVREADIPENRKSSIRDPQKTSLEQQPKTWNNYKKSINSALTTYPLNGMSRSFSQ